MSQFGIVIEPFPLHRRCDCGHEHQCVAFCVTSAVPKHHAEKRPARSLHAWYADKPTPLPSRRAG